MMEHNNCCVMCGEIIPEGIQCCPLCSKDIERPRRIAMERKNSVCSLKEKERKGITK